FSVAKSRVTAPSLSLEFFQSLPAAGFRILAAVKVVSLCDLHHAQTLRVVVRTAQRAPAANNPSASLRGRCCASTIFALPRSVPSLLPSQRPRRFGSALTIAAERKRQRWQRR